MRPQRLVMRAFGPYAGEQVIDFSELGNRTLFLIHGPTGAGKTTILDALCYALYGDTSGNERTGRHLRSDHAGPEALTEVELEFEVGATAYKVFRRPQQEHVKKPGQAPSSVRHEAKLWKSQQSTAAPIEWNLVTAKTSEVEREVEGLLGFRSDQFRQVVMLPQGQFRQLLVSSSKDREKILAVLFRTAVYKGTEEELKQAARSIEDRVKQARNDVGTVLKLAVAEGRNDIAARIESGRARLEQLVEEKTRLQGLSAETRELLNQAMLVNEKLRELSEAKGAFGKLEAKAPEFAARRSSLEQARRALSLVPEENALEKRLREAEGSKGDLSKARSNLERFRNQKDAAEHRLEEERSREGTRDALRKEMMRLDALTERVKGIEQTVHDLRQAVTVGDNARKAVKGSIKKREECQARLEEKQQALRETEKTAERVELLRDREKQARDNWEHRKRLDKCLEDESVMRRELARATKVCAKTEQAFTKAESAYAELETDWLDGQAAVLARTLVPGEPCPVCGASEHPAPAGSEKPIPGDTDLKQAKRNLERLRTSLQEDRDRKAQLESGLRESQAVADVFRKHLGDLQARTKDELQAVLQLTSDELSKALAAGERIKKITKEMEALRKADAVAVAEQQEAERLGKEADSRRDRLEGTFAEQQRDVPKDLCTHEALEQAKQNAGEAITRMEKALEAATKAQSRAAEGLAAGQARVEAAEQSLLVAAEKSLAQQQAFDRGLKEGGFEGRKAYQSVRRTPAEIEQMEEQIRRFESARSAAVDRLERAEAQAADLEKPDIEALDAAAKGASKDLELAVGQEVTAHEAIKRDSGFLATLDQAAKELEALEQQYAVVGRISEVANGKNREGISFQRFVLASLLDDVMLAASERLKIMSDRRFALARVRERTSGHGAGGLDLEVHDAYTGTSRPVETLSGGEGFLASLSLALGLADVVQSYSGGIRLDTVFVDEGFGSLDPEALDLAYRALVDLQSTGRLVGIISHVPDLKEQIDVRLEVAAGRNGSTARFVIG